MLDPYDGVARGPWLKGNLHTHTTRSDGTLPIQEVIDRYAALGHDFLMISDHDRWSGPEDYADLDARGMVLVSGNEVTARGPHVLQIGGSEATPPDQDRQAVCDAIAEQGGLSVLCHPDWQAHHNHFSYDRLAAIRGACGVEIFNGSVTGVGDTGSALSLGKWDRLISRPDAPPVWGFATDDSHRDVDIGCGWISVCTDDRSASGILDAIRRGCFYASSGVAVTRVGRDGDRFFVDAPEAQRIVCYREAYRRVAVSDGPGLSVEVPDDARFLRFDCFGHGETRAWTQPIFFDRD